jgi:ATP-dependent protease HslVU (ClpYQ) peptidase subunit
LTCIIAIKAEHSVWIGSDGRVSEDSQTSTDDFVKWREVKGIWWAAAGYTRLYSLFDNHRDRLSIFDNCLGLCEFLRGLVIHDNWNAEAEEKGGPVRYLFDIIVTDGHEVGQYAGDGSYVKLVKPGQMAAYGSGAKYALGAARAMLDAGEPYETAIEAALAAACIFDQGCGGDLMIQEVEL